MHITSDEFLSFKATMSHVIYYGLSANRLIGTKTEVSFTDNIHKYVYPLSIAVSSSSFSPELQEAVLPCLVLILR